MTRRLTNFPLCTKLKDRTVEVCGLWITSVGSPNTLLGAIILVFLICSYILSDKHFDVPLNALYGSELIDNIFVINLVQLKAISAYSLGIIFCLTYRGWLWLLLFLFVYIVLISALHLFNVLGTYYST